MSDQLDQLCINTVRFLSVDAVQKAKSGHPGMPLGAAPMAYVLWTRLLKHNPRNPDWFDRDRFVLSAGHGSMLLYSLLHLTGYDLSLMTSSSFASSAARRRGILSADIRPVWRPPPDRSVRVSPTRSAWRSPKHSSRRATTVPDSM